MEESNQQEDEDRDNPQPYRYSGAFNADNDEKGESFARPLDPLDMALMDEQRIEPTKVISINAADVLCGRGKMSFNHGT
jgi:predicted Ser/Thr protein kinase